MTEKKIQPEAGTESKRNQDWDIRKQEKNGGKGGPGSGAWGWVLGRSGEWERKREREENEYSKHCFNLKQRCFQENEFQWSWAKNNYRDFLVLFCEWRASLFSGDVRVRKDQSQEIEVMPLCPFTSTQHSSGPFFLPLSKSYWHQTVLGREGSGSSPPI